MIDMENGKIYVAEGKVSLFNRTLSLGIKYNEVINLFDDVVNSSNTYRDIKGRDCACIKLLKSNIYGISGEMQLFFCEDVLYKMRIALNANDTVVNSNHTGIRLYQDKVMGTAIRIKEEIGRQYDLKSNGDEMLFIYCDEDKLLFSSIDRDCMECSLIFELQDGGAK